MPLYVYNGTLLRTSNKLSTNENCCCGGGVGACCTPAFGCLGILTEEECNWYAGTFKGVGTSELCGIPDTCECVGAPFGDCCVAESFLIRDIPECDCLRISGVPKPPGSPLAACNNPTCGEFGSCCFPDGTCVPGMDKCLCTSLGGDFLGEQDCTEETCIDRTGGDNGLADDDCVVCTAVTTSLTVDSGGIVCLTSSNCNSNPGANCNDITAETQCIADVIGWSPEYAPCKGTPTCVNCSNGRRCVLSGNFVECQQKSREQVQFLTSWGYCKQLESYDINFYQYMVQDGCGGSYPFTFGQAYNINVRGRKVCEAPECDSTGLKLTNWSVSTASCAGPCAGGTSAPPYFNTEDGNCSVCSQCQT